MALNISADQFSVGDFQRDYLFTCKLMRAQSLYGPPALAGVSGNVNDPLTSASTGDDAIIRALRVLAITATTNPNIEYYPLDAQGAVGAMQQLEVQQIFNTSTVSLEAVNNALDLIVAKGIMPESKTNVIQIKTGGETINMSGPDESGKSGDFTFRCPVSSLGSLLSFFEALKGTTGDYNAHSALPKAYQVFDFEVSYVDSSKSFVTYGRYLRNCMITGIKPSDPDKEGSGIATLTVTMAWDRNERVKPNTPFNEAPGFTELLAKPAIVPNGGTP